MVDEHDSKWETKRLPLKQAKIPALDDASRIRHSPYMQVTELNDRTADLEGEGCSALDASLQTLPLTSKAPSERKARRKSSERRTSNSTQSLLSLARPTFTGSWIVSRIEGDWDAFLVEMNVGFMKRKAIRLIGYGVGKLQEEILQYGDASIVITSRSPMSTVRNELRIDGTQQDAQDPEGAPVEMTVSWEDDKLCSRGCHKNPRTPLPTVYRSISGDVMCTEMQSPAGCSVKRFFSRE